MSSIKNKIKNKQTKKQCERDATGIQMNSAVFFFFFNIQRYSLVHFEDFDFIIKVVYTQS